MFNKKQTNKPTKVELFLKNLILKFFITVLISISVFAQENSIVKISGYMFGDYYWVTQNQNKDILGKNGFWIRRIYLTFDKEITTNFSARLRFDMSSAGDFSSKNQVIPVVKDAYLDWKPGNLQLTFGLSPTPAFTLVEKIWKYRSVEKTISDLQKLVSTRDIGIAAKGKIDVNGVLKYHLMVANGNGDKSESDKGKIVMLSLDIAPIEKISLEIYCDWNDLYGKNDWYTFHVFCGLEFKDLNLGVQYVRQIRQAENKKATNIDAASIFFSTSISEDFSLLGRIDRMLDPNPQGNTTIYLPFNKTAKSTLFITGLDYHPVKDVSFIPNVEVIMYDNNDKGIRPVTDVVSKLTFYYSF